jgi:uncharacterized protein YdhG (YjbR/CyaY superfamily)
MTDIDAYFSNLNVEQRAELERIRETAKQLVPATEEVIGYGVPTLKYNKKPLIYYAAFKDHISIFPASDPMVETIGAELGKFRTSKGTFQFPYDTPIPKELLKKIVNYRKSEIDNSSK